MDLLSCSRDRCYYRLYRIFQPLCKDWCDGAYFVVFQRFGLRICQTCETAYLMEDICAGCLFFGGGVFLGCFILLIAFFTSRGEFHTDTNIYHAAAIRLYEEYGVLKGAGNLQLHYAYNSAYLAFASIFSLRWLFGQSIHTTTGFLEVIMCLYAFYGLKE